MKTKTSRRVALAGNTVVPMLSTSSNAIDNNKSDPIFASIEKHRAVWRKADTLCKINSVREHAFGILLREQSSNPSRTKNIQEAERAKLTSENNWLDADFEADKAWGVLMSTVPTTRAGCVALFDYILGEVTESGNLDYYFEFGGRNEHFKTFIATVREGMTQLSF